MLDIIFLYEAAAEEPGGLAHVSLADIHLSPHTVDLACLPTESVL
jgi:hypothetical protein